MRCPKGPAPLLLDPAPPDCCLTPPSKGEVGTWFTLKPPVWELLSEQAQSAQMRQELMRDTQRSDT